MRGKGLPGLMFGDCFVILPIANQDLSDAIHYIAEELWDPEAALAFIDEIERAIS